MSATTVETMRKVELETPASNGSVDRDRRYAPVGRGCRNRPTSCAQQQDGETVAKLVRGARRSVLVFPAIAAFQGFDGPEPEPNTRTPGRNNV